MLKYYNYDIVFAEIPEEVTLAINLSNCPNRCNGCHSPWLTQNIGSTLTDSKIRELLAQYGKSVTCICFMGGDADPFEIQRLALLSRSIAPHIKAGWYSGRSSIPKGVKPTSFSYIKLGPYVAHLGGLDAATSNQHLYKIHSNDDWEDITAAVRHGYLRATTSV